MNSRPLTVCEKTTSHTVSGIARASPIGPHSHVQNATEIRSAIDETPALLAKNKGSRTKAMIVSATMKSPTMSRGSIQPSKTARLTKTGIAAATQAPAYGMKRSSAPKTPHVSANGSPSTKSPTAIVMPKLALRAVCVSRYRLIRSLASSSARVVSARRSGPKRRTTRARSSRCWMSMKTTSNSTKTAPPTGSTILVICQSGLGADTTTGSGFLAGGLARSICAITSWAVSSTFWSVPPLPTRCTSAIFRAMVARYWGRSSTSVVTWLTRAHPTATTSRTARAMTMTTAATRCNPVRRSSATTGDNRNVASSASAMGMKTMRAQYRHAMARMRPPRTTSRGVPDVSRGLRGLTRELTEPER